jgi:hypothetical protein
MELAAAEKQPQAHTEPAGQQKRTHRGQGQPLGTRMRGLTMARGSSWRWWRGWPVAVLLVESEAKFPSSFT